MVLSPDLFFPESSISIKPPFLPIITFLFLLECPKERDFPMQTLPIRYARTASKAPRDLTPFLSF